MNRTTSGMYAFFAALDAFIAEFARMSVAWKDRASGQVAEIARNIGTVMSGIGQAVDVVVKVLETKDVDAGTIKLHLRARSTW